MRRHAVMMILLASLAGCNGSDPDDTASNGGAGGAPPAGNPGPLPAPDGAGPDGIPDRAPLPDAAPDIPPPSGTPGLATLQTGACQPRFDLTRDGHLFVWRDGEDRWHVQAFGGADGAVQYDGRISSTAPLELADPPDAGLTDHGPEGIAFELAPPAGGHSGFAFRALPGSELTLELDPGDAIRLGTRRAPVSTPVRLDRTGPCGVPETGAAPAVGTPGALHLWRSAGEGSVDRWHVSVSPGTTVYRGAIVSDVPFESVSPGPLGGGDRISTGTPGSITFQLGSAEESASGFHFEVARGAHPCLSLEDAGGNGAVLLGPERLAVSPPLDLGTVGECPPPSGDGVYNYVIVLTDDQRADTIGSGFMPLLRSRIEAHGGIDFINAYVTIPLCCPARSTIHAGGIHAHRTGVLENTGPNGNIDLFRDDRTLARLLHDRGYSTFFAGKYFSTYAGAIYERSTPYIPPGWTRFIGRSSWTDDRQGWFNFRYTVGSSRDIPGIGRAARVGTYTMDYEKEAALAFIDQVRERPFYMFLAPSAPHAPAVPFTADVGAFDGFLHQSPSLDEDVSDKPDWVSTWPTRGNVLSQQFIRDQLESLQAVDRAMAELIDRIEAHGLLDRTIFIFMSDNGILWGEHGLWGKGVAYEESVRVPLVVIAPQSAQPREESALVAANLDIGATIADLAGLDLTAGGTTRGSDGFSLRPLLERSGGWERDMVMMESFGRQVDLFGLWTAVVRHQGREQWKYIEHGNGEEELYDLVADPHELDNLHDDPAWFTEVQELRGIIAARRPLAITTFNPDVPRGTVGQYYETEITAWGGVPPYEYEWSLNPAFPLPDGLALAPHPRDPMRAVISGIPQRPVCRQPVWIIVEDVQDPNRPPETEHGRGQRFTNETYRFTMAMQGDSGRIDPCANQSPSGAGT